MDIRVWQSHAVQQYMNIQSGMVISRCLASTAVCTNSRHGLKPCIRIHCPCNLTIIITGVEVPLGGWFNTSGNYITAWVLQVLLYSYIPPWSPE